MLPAIPDISATVYAETPRLELDLNRVNPGTANCGTPKTAVAVLLDLNLFVELHAGASGPGIKNAYNDVTLYVSSQPGPAEQIAFANKRYSNMSRTSLLINA